MMDIKKFKGINWVGNIYQKFEEICHEVEDIVIQDKFKVEAQVQTVSKNVKKIYSDVQDLLPPLLGAVKHDAQDVAIKENFAITRSKENLEETFLDLIEKKSPTEPSAMDPGTNQLSLVSSTYDLADQLDSPTSMEALEVSEPDFSSGKIDQVSQYPTGKQSPPSPNVMDVVTNQLTLVSSQYHITDQPSSPTSVDGFQVSEFDLSVGKVCDVLTNEGLLDETTKMPYIVDPGINQLVVSSKYHLPDQPNSPTSRDTPGVSEWGLEEIDEVLAKEDSLDATENQSPLEPIVMDTVVDMLSHVSSKYHLEDQPSSPTSMDSFEVPESKLSAGKIDEVLTNERFLDATETQSPTEANVMDPVENKMSLFFSKYNLADRLSSPYSVDNLEVLESDLSVAKMDDGLTMENSDANKEQISMQLSEPILLELTSPVVSEHFAVPPFGVSSHSDHGNRHSVLPEVAPTTSAHGSDFQSQKKLTFCDNSSDGIECVRGACDPASEMAFSVPSGENTTEKMDVAKECSLGMSSGKNPLLRPSEYSPEKLLQAMFSCNSVEVDGCSPDASFGVSSSASPLSVLDKNKNGEKEHSSFSSVLSLNSVGISRITEIMPPTVPSSKEQVEVYETVQDDVLKSSSDIGCPDASSSDSSHSHMETIDLHDKVILEENSSHSRMETIDLHDKVKLEESCVIVDDSMLHAISSRARKLRSYKQRIQDAFTSKKRLAKEYEQLAIWFGDTDIDLTQEIPPDTKTLQTLNARDFEWELL